MRQISSISSLLKLLAFTFLLVSTNVSAQDAAAGEKLFKANCATCHKWEGKATGPELKGVVDRIQPGAAGDVDAWLKLWIKDNAKLRASGDAYANKVYNENGKQAMTAFGFFSDAQLADVVAFLHAGPSLPPPPTGDPDNNTDVNAPVEEEGSSDLWLLLIVITIATIVIVVFTGVNRSMKNVIKAREGKEAEESKSFFEAIGHWMQNNKKWASIVGLIVVLTLAKLGWDALFEIGVYTDYQPKQPIAFPHDLHAGKNQIDCKYCHSSARTSKTSGIPSANVCMNCHKAIDKGSRSGKTEIAKLYKYVGWNPDSAKYITKDGKMRSDTAIEWVRVHNLPDFVYFNHSQHVEVGKVACQKCHGEVEKMEEVKQFSDLTMGWCVNCHRETEVQFAGNEYYIKIHEDAKAENKHKKDFKFTVDKIGGLECAKCHY